MDITVSKFGGHGQKATTENSDGCTITLKDEDRDSYVISVETDVEHDEVRIMVSHPERDSYCVWSVLGHR